MPMTVEKYFLIIFKHRHEFESTDFDRYGIVQLIKHTCNKSFARNENNLESIIDRGWFHLDREPHKDPAILKKIRLENEQLDNQHYPPLLTNPPIQENVSTDNLKIFSEITPLP